MWVDVLRCDCERPHHLVILMVDDMAVPDVARADRRIEGEQVDARRGADRVLRRDAHSYACYLTRVHL